MEKWKRKLPLPRTKFHSETSMSFFIDPNGHELSLTVTFSHGQKCLHNYHKLWHCLLHLITTPPPPSTRFSRWLWEAWTLLDCEIISRSKSHQPWKSWKLLQIMTFPVVPHYLGYPPPLHKIFSPALTSMNSPWQWDFLMTKIFTQLP